MGRRLRLTQDVRIEVMRPADVERLQEPMCPEAVSEASKLNLDASIVLSQRLLLCNHHHLLTSNHLTHCPCSPLLPYKIENILFLPTFILTMANSAVHLATEEFCRAFLPPLDSTSAPNHIETNPFDLLEDANRIPQRRISELLVSHFPAHFSGSAEL